jgi:hypothetical protein
MGALEGQCGSIHQVSLEMASDRQGTFIGRIEAGMCPLHNRYRQRYAVNLGILSMESDHLEVGRLPFGVVNHFGPGDYSALFFLDALFHFYAA